MSSICIAYGSSFFWAHACGDKNKITHLCRTEAALPTSDQTENTAQKNEQDVCCCSTATDKIVVVVLVVFVVATLVATVVATTAFDTTVVAATTATVVDFRIMIPYPNPPCTYMETKERDVRKRSRHP